MLNIFKNKTAKLGYSIKLVYQITAHLSDTEIMHSLKAFFNNVGNIEFSQEGRYVSYRVYKTKDIVNEIRPHFESYSLQSSKFIYYILWFKFAILMSKVYI